MRRRKFRTEQEEFWAGSFGEKYIGRNVGAAALASNLHFFSRALRQAPGIRSCVEFGANVGVNLQALQLLYPGHEQHAVEINAAAVRQLGRVIPRKHVHHASILDFKPRRRWDLVVIKGVLIHLNPDRLTDVYAALARACGRYLLMSEYYNPSPVAIPYRGHADRLFKRDFAGEFLERHPRFMLLDYGFGYRRDPRYPQDDATWFLMERR